RPDCANGEFPRPRTPASTGRRDGRGRRRWRGRRRSADRFTGSAFDTKSWPQRTVPVRKRQKIQKLLRAGCLNFSAASSRPIIPSGLRESLTVLKFDPAAAGDSPRHDKSGRLFQFVSRDLELVTVRIAEIDRMRNFVVLK